MGLARKLIKFLSIIRRLDSLFLRGLRFGVFPAIEHLSALQTLADLRHVIDIGANRGQFSLVARRVFPHATIHAFEPLQEPARIFRDVFEGDECVRLTMCAIGPERKDSVMHVAQRDDSSSLLPIGPKQLEVFRGTGLAETRGVPELPLGDILGVDELRSPSLLKIDVQGYELEVLRGCQGLLNGFAYAYVECSFAEMYLGQALAYEVIGYLERLGFRLVGVYNVAHDPHGVAIQADFLFTNGNCNQVNVEG